MFCENCGNLVKDGQKFCKNCGCSISYDEQYSVPNIQPSIARSQDNNRMSNEDLKKYLKGVMDAELDIVFQKQVISELQKTYDGMGISKKFSMPRKGSTDANFKDCLETAVGICGIAGAIIGFFVEVGNNFLLAIIEAIVMFFVVGIVGGFIFGAIYYFAKLTSQKSKIASVYESEMKRYESNLKEDKQRVLTENHQKQALLHEINSMKDALKETQEHLAEMYSYNIINTDYHNLTAVTSFYGYFSKGMTYSLTLTPGDRGAYNLYQDELRNGIIVKNLNDISNRLDDIRKTQYVLVEGIQRVNSSVKHMCSAVTSQLDNISEQLGSIEHNQEVVAYNTNRTANQVEFANWMRKYD